MTGAGVRRSQSGSCGWRWIGETLPPWAPKPFLGSRRALPARPGTGPLEEPRMDASYKNVLYEKRNGIALVALNRPRVGNATNHAMQQELAAIWRDFAQDDSLKVAILTGKGRSFFSGLDLREAAGPSRR